MFGGGGGGRPGGGGGVFGGGGIPGRNVPDVTDVIERGVSDAFCASAGSFRTRNSKVQFDETLLEKGKMFSVIDSDFQVNITLQYVSFEIFLQIPKSGFYNFQITYDTDLCGALSLCGPTVVSIRSGISA